MMAGEKEAVLRDEKAYTLIELKVLWAAFNKKKMLRVQQGGVWKFVPLSGKGVPRLQGTKAEIVGYKHVKNFIEFLEEEGA